MGNEWTFLRTFSGWLKVAKVECREEVTGGARNVLVCRLRGRLGNVQRKGLQGLSCRGLSGTQGEGASTGSTGQFRASYSGFTRQLLSIGHRDRNGKPNNGRVAREAAVP
jgi:hypothetical protein